MPELTALSEEARRRAMERFELLRPHLEQGKALTLVAREAGVPYRTASRWVSLYRQYGLAALARKGRSDRGGRRVLTPELLQVIEGLALEKPPRSAAAVYREVYQLAQRQGRKPPSYSLVHAVIQQLPADLRTLAHAGGKAYADAYELVHRREAARPNAIWQADHSPLDILLVRDDGNLTKPWLTVVLDDYSRAVAGYYLSFEAPTAIQTALALRQAIWRKDDPRWPVCGIPEVLYTDNGSDFTSQHLEQVAADLKIQLIFSTPGKPRGRGRIERFFETVTQLFLAAQPGYVPPGGTVRGTPSLTLEALDRAFRTFVLDTYHRRPQRETRSAPQERWQEGGFLPQMPQSLEQLDLLLLTVVRARKVHPDGIRFQGLRYVDPTLAAYVGEAITLRYDPRDMAEVRVFHQDRFLCRALCPELAGETIRLRDIVQARNRRRRELRALLRERKNTVETLLELKRGEVTSPPSPPADEPDPTPPLKRYRNE